MRSARATAVAALVAAATLGWHPAATAQPAPITARAFTLRANAFPVQIAPGENGTVLAVAPAATQLSVSNPPGSSYARAAFLDTSAIEQYTGPPAAGTVAECSTETGNIKKQSAATPNGMTLAARCDETPFATARAAASDLSQGGFTAASVVSQVTGGQDGSTLKAVSTVVARDGAVGPLTFGVARYTATISANGVPGGSTARGVIVIADASFAGIPVSIGSEGIDVDQTRVPLDLVNTVRDQLLAALLHSDFHDIKLVQPTTSVTKDGKHADVTGGGLLVYFTNANPAGRYFIGMTVLGGSISAVVGDPLEAVRSPIPTDLIPPAFLHRTGPKAPETVVEAKQLAGPSARVVATTSTVRSGLPLGWAGMPWAVGSIAVLTAAWLGGGDRIRRRLDVVAERYLRG
jgi:hypothetical protein